MNAPKALLSRAVPFEIRKDASGDGFTLEGYAAVFNKATRIDSWEGKFDEIIAQGAFARTIQDRKPVMQFDHGHDLATGSVPIGAIKELKEDKKGLFVQARLHDNDRVEPIRQAIESGAIDGMSFRFRVVREEWDETPDIPVRTIKEVELFELGPVVFPAYASTTVGVRSLLSELPADERQRLLAELRAELAPSDDAGQSATSSGAKDDAGQSATSSTKQDTDAGQGATSGATPGEREAFLRSLLIERTIAA